MAKKAKEEVLNLDNILFKCRDILRQAKNSGSFFEKRDMMLTLVFLRFIGEKYEDSLAELRQELIDQDLDPDDEEIIKAFFDDMDGTYALPEEARWSTIINTPAPQLNVALDTALRSIATSNAYLKGCFVEGTFTQRNLGANDIKKIVDEVNKISHKTFGEEKDLIGRVYEYFLKEFAVNATKEEGEFYTPHDAVQLIATVIEPFDGTLYDPCCGSGGMFIQSTELVKARQGDISRINIYGQEKDAATYRLAKMNLALRGISHNLGSENDSTFSNDLHKGLYFDYIMANPPFNLKGWWDDNLKNDARWTDYGLPPESNANYAWILHMLSHLKPLSGVAGFLLANGALGDTDALEIRKRLIQNDKVEAIIILPRELFITTDISVTFWILNQNKKGGRYHGRELRNREHEILFMDLRRWTENPVKGEQKKKVQLITDQIQRVAGLYHQWQSVGTDGKNFAEPELYRSVGIEEIEQNNWTLVPSKYIEFIDHDLEIDYPKEMARIQQEMRELMAREKESQRMLEEAFKVLAMGLRKYKLGELTERSTANNRSLKYGNELIAGVNNDGVFTVPKGDPIDVDLKPYKIVNDGAFVYNPTRLELGSIAYRTHGLCIVSHLYQVFYLNAKGKEILDPVYLFMFFRRDEFYRQVKFRNFGSQRPEFSYNDMADIVITLPSIEQQRKYVDVYLSLQNNLTTYQSNVDDLKLVCDGYLDQLKEKCEKVRLGELLTEVDRRNTDSMIKTLKGINIEKKFMDSVADTIGVDLSKYKVVHLNEFAFSGMQTGRDECIRIALNQGQRPIIVSPAYTVLKNNKQDVLNYYILLWFSRKEIDRYGWFASDASIRSNLDLERFYDMLIPLPSIDIQRNLVQFFCCYIERQRIATQLKEQLNNLCPILIKGSLETRK